MDQVRAALYLDFDNVFIGLAKLDPAAALRFAEQPRSWLEPLVSTLTTAGQRRWLVLRCYMNPAGWVPHPSGEGRVYFSRFRPSFTTAGFEVIDCPRLSLTKNGADIRLVVDAVDALAVVPTYEEFIVASGDSDMTPLLVRLRAADRRTTIVSPSDAAGVLEAVADRYIDGGQLLELLQERTVEPDDEPVVGESREVLPLTEGLERFRALVEDRYAASPTPLNLAQLAHELHRDLGATILATRWFGRMSFGRAVESLELADAEMSHYFLWDRTRHEPPAQDESRENGRPAEPEPVARVAAVVNLPHLPQPTWAHVYRALADYAAVHEFNLTEATRWARDRLVADEVEVNRNAIGFVVRGATYGGKPLYAEPPPSAEEIGEAFVANVLSRAEAADVALSAEDRDVVRSWLGAGQDAP